MPNRQNQLRTLARREVSTVDAAKLRQKTEQVYEQVSRQVQRQESLVDALGRTEQLVAAAETGQASRSQLDIEKARLRDMISEKANLQQTVGTLIAGYDALTNSLGGEIESIKAMTIWETLVGYLSPAKARRMREARIQAADIDVQLQDLVVQTQGINQLLTEHLGVLNHEYTTVREMLDEQLVRHKETLAAFEDLDLELETLDVAISEKREVIAELTGADRARANEELQALVNEANEITEQRNTALSNAQTHELFAENHKIALDSLLRQKSTQRVLIDKLRISTENRIVQYSATVESLRTAAQQESAHVINDIGTHVDQEATRTMAGIGAAADRQILEMLERHESDVSRRRTTQLEIARVDAEFARRFAEVAESFLQEAYEEAA